MTEKVIEAKKINLTIGQHHILDIDYFSVHQGETVALIGPNASGKSTLLKVLMLLQRPTAGELFLKGEKVDWNKPLSYRRRMAMVFQEPLLLDTSVYKNIEAGLKLRGVNKKLIPEKIALWLNRLSIEHLARRSVRFLSGGESQRVSIARALALEPEVLFLDEPFSALDAPTRVALTVELAEIIKETGITSIFVTHDYSEITIMAETVTVLDYGRVIQSAPAREVLARPADRVVASLVGVENAIPGLVNERSDSGFTVQAGSQLLQAPAVAGLAGDKVYILLRPDEVKITGSRSIDWDNSLQGTVSELLPQGYQFKAVLDCGFPLKVILSPDQVIGGEVTKGSEVFVNFNTGKLHLIDRAD
ncbi:MAG: Maltose/maltodextrin import ATP-binding protein MalK [Pelotomaculum sp. PtaB.Bin104]|nr:MAG: Maltose/maltodextrin import ATP-binding protein MalK [Pelotomaculum sp. PtaB.Bin104]